MRDSACLSRMISFTVQGRRSRFVHIDDEINVSDRTSRTKYVHRVLSPDTVSMTLPASPAAAATGSAFEAQGSGIEGHNITSIVKQQCSLGFRGVATGLNDMQSGQPAHRCEGVVYVGQEVRLEI